MYLISGYLLLLLYLGALLYYHSARLTVSKSLEYNTKNILDNTGYI